MHLRAHCTITYDINNKPSCKRQLKIHTIVLKKDKSEWFVYILECSDQTFYTGITNNLNRRIQQHNFDDKGAKYTRSRRPVHLRYVINCENRSQASVLEIKIKKLTRAEKACLIASQTSDYGK